MDDKELEILFNLEIQLDDHKTANIVLRENEDIKEVVDKLCKTHQLGENIKLFIMNQISQTLDRNFKDCKKYNKHNIEEEYDKFLNYDLNDNILTTGTYGGNNRQTANNSNRIDNYFITDTYEIKEQSPKFNKQEYSVYCRELENLPISDSISLNKDELNFVDNVENFKENDYKKNELKLDISRPDPQTPKSNNSFSNFLIDKVENKSSNIIPFTKRRSKKGSLPKDRNQKSNNTTSKKQFNESETNVNFSNAPPLPGQRLYNQYMEKLPKKIEYIKKVIEERINEELKEATFKPEIFKKISYKIVSNSPIRKFENKIEDRLLNYNEKRRYKIIEEMSKNRLLDNDYSYHPSINDKSQIIASVKRKQRLSNISNLKEVINKSCDAPKTNLIYEVDSNHENYPIENKKLEANKNNNPNVQKHEGRNKTPLNKKTILTKKVEAEVKSKERFKTPIARTQMDKTPRKINKGNKDSISPSKSPVRLNPENNIHDFLYIESKLMREKKKKIESEFLKKAYPFKPQIADSKQKSLKRVETKEEFIKRLVSNKKEGEELNNKSNIKQESRKKYCTPSLSRGPSDTRYKDVKIDLFGFSDGKLLLNNSKAKDINYSTNVEKKNIFIEKSIKTILKMKIERYKQIFEILDSDNDGLISSKHIGLSQFDTEMLKFLTPVLENLQKNNLTMNFKEFCITSDQLFSFKILRDNKKLN